MPELPPADVATAELALRPATTADLPALTQIFCEVHAEQFAGSGVPAETLAPLLDMQFRAQRAQYSQVHPQAQDSLIEVDGRIVGRCWVDASDDAVRVLDLAVRPAARRRGIATGVLHRLREQTADGGRCLHLSVWRDNHAARSLYAGLGFGLRHERPDGYLELCCPTEGHACPAGGHACPADTLPPSSPARKADSP